MFINIILSSVVVMLASLVGVVAIWKTLGSVVERHLKYLVSFSAGVFAIIAFTLSSETIELAHSSSSGPTWILVGILLVLVFFKFIPGFHHHHDEGCHGDKCNQDKLNPKRIMMGDALHNVGDGFLLTASFLINPALGLLTTVSIFFHELVQELSEFFVLREAGYSLKKALKLNFLVSGTILFGSVGSFFLIESFHFLEVPLMGIAAGSFIVIVLFDLLPHSVRNSRANKTYALHILCFVIGFALMSYVNLLTHGTHTHGGEIHNHDDHEHEEHEEGEHHDDHEHEEVEHI